MIASLRRRTSRAALDRRRFLMSLAGVAALGSFGLTTRKSYAADSDPYAYRAERMREGLTRLASYSAASIPGFQVACILDGDVAWTEGLGVRNNAGDGVTPETVFDLGSLTKVVMSTAVLRLVERDLFDLDRPLIEYARVDIPRPEALAEKVTARHVLTHQTGLPNWRPFEPGSAVEFKQAPGSGFTYSGEGFFWLQRVIESVVDLPLPLLVEKEVFQPLGMRRSSLVFETRFSNDYAQGFRRLGEPAVDSYNKQNSERVQHRIGEQEGSLRDLFTSQAWRLASRSESNEGLRPSPVLTPANAAGSLQSTAAEYARLLTVYMRNGVAAGLLERETVARTLRPVTEVNRHISYGIGWRLEQLPAGLSFWHSGYNDGFHSFALGDPNGRYGVVVLTNSDRGNRLRWPVVYEGTGHGAAAIIS